MTRRLPAGVALAASSLALRAAAAAAVPPRGYRTAISPTFTSPHLGGVSAAVGCPAGTVPLGGGALVASFSTRVALAGSFPTADGWGVDVDNESADDTT